MSTAPLAGLGEMPAPATRRTIPFDMAFRYVLTGERGHVLRQILTVSIEATFVAVSIGYGVVPTVSTLTFGPAPPPTTGLLSRPPSSIRGINFGLLLDGLANSLDDHVTKGGIGPRVAAVLASGLRLNPVFAAQAMLGGGNAPLDPGALGRAFQAVGAPADRVQFRYALFDDATGREFQSEPILNIAGLGIADGDRPFRHFAQPITFAPRSTIRLEITEESEFQGELHVSLQGYKILGGAGSPTGRGERPRGRRTARLRRRA
jgi:hypothetical protein